MSDELDLDAIEARYLRAYPWGASDSAGESCRDVPALIAEVRSLRDVPAATAARGERVAREALMRAVTGDYDQPCGVCEECAVKIVDAILELGGSAPRLGASV